MCKYEKTQDKVFRGWFYLKFELFVNAKGFVNLHQGVWILNDTIRRERLKLSISKKIS